MKQAFTQRMRIALIGVLLVGMIGACDKKKEERVEEQAPQKDSVNTPAEQISVSNQSELLRTIAGPSGGVFRGLSFGDPVSKIKMTETFDMFEDSTDHVGYTYETENFESVDVLYYLDKSQTLNNIRVDIYLTSPNSVRNLRDQFDTYLSGRYRMEKRGGRVAWWRGNDNMLVKLEDVTKGKDYGLRLSLGKKGNPALAM
jgi:hypothetical protein